MSRIKARRLTGTLLSLALAATLALPSGSLAAGALKPGPPDVSTGGVGHVRGTSALLQGTVNPHGLATTYYFQYGRTVAYGAQTAPAALPAGTVKVKVGQTVTGLLVGYHYRLVATNSAGTTMGKDRAFGSKSVRARFTLPKNPEPTAYNETFVLSGTLAGAGNANRRIALQASPFPFLEPFASVGLPIVTDGAGRFTFRVPHLLTSTQFRVTTLDPRPLFSSILTEHVAIKVTLKVRVTKQRGLVRLYGTVTPARVGARVLFQLSKPARPGNSEKNSERTSKFATQFSAAVKRGTKTVSRFSAIVNVLHSGRYRAYVQLRKGALVSGASPTVTLKSGPAVKKGKGKGRKKH